MSANERRLLVFEKGRSDKDGNPTYVADHPDHKQMTVVAEKDWTQAEHTNFRPRLALWVYLRRTKNCFVATPIPWAELTPEERELTNKALREQSKELGRREENLQRREEKIAGQEQEIARQKTAVAKQLQGIERLRSLLNKAIEQAIANGKKLTQLDAEFRCAVVDLARMVDPSYEGNLTKADSFKRDVNELLNDIGRLIGVTENLAQVAG